MIWAPCLISRRTALRHSSGPSAMTTPGVTGARQCQGTWSVASAVVTISAEHGTTRGPSTSPSRIAFASDGSTAYGDEAPTAEVNPARRVFPLLKAALYAR